MIRRIQFLPGQTLTQSVNGGRQNVAPLANPFDAQHRNRNFQIPGLMPAHDRGMTEEKRLHSIALRQTANFPNSIKLMLPVQSFAQK
jgi:hypothetical protein